MFKSYKLTDEENNELYQIAKLLRSPDKESQELGIGLLKNYPGKARVKCVFINRCDYTDTLEDFLLKYELKIYTIKYIIDFVVRLLLDQHYYI